MTRLTIHIAGVTPAELHRGILAAMAVLGPNASGAAAARFKQEGEEEDLTDIECRLAEWWHAADQAAVNACCAGWADKPDTANIELLVRKGEDS